MHIARQRMRHLTLAVMVVVVLAGCDSTEPTRRTREIVASTHLTGAAAAALRSNNEFALGSASSLNGETMISGQQARHLALAFLRTFGASFRTSWEADRGGPIDLGALVAARRVYFAQSPYGGMLRKDVHPAYRRQYGPFFLVTLLQGGAPAVVIAVSALTTEYSIDQQGLLRSPVYTGMDFVHHGIPPEGADFSPLTPEAAAVLAAEATGSEVESAPELVLPGKDISPALARWKVQLSRPANIRSRTDASHGSTRSLYIGPNRSARFAIDDNDGGTESHPAVLTERDNPRRRIMVSVSRHANRATKFRIVDPLTEK